MQLTTEGDLIFLESINRETAVKVFNQISRQFEIGAWFRIAESLRLGGVLPAAKRDDLGLYEASYLQVFVKAATEKSDAGSYTCGRIEVECCEHCTDARLFWVFCHEIVHAWVDNFAPDYQLSSSIEQVGDDFADRMLVRVGGNVTDPSRCATYRFAREGKPVGREEALATESVTNALRGALRTHCGDELANSPTLPHGWSGTPPTDKGTTRLW